MTKKINLAIHFMDGTKIVIEYNRQTDQDSATIASNVSKALDSDKIVAEVDGSLLVIPANNIKYVAVTPPPDILPKGVLQHAHLSE